MASLLWSKTFVSVQCVVLQDVLESQPQWYRREDVLLKEKGNDRYVSLDTLKMSINSFKNIFSWYASYFRILFSTKSLLEDNNLLSASTQTSSTRSFFSFYCAMPYISRFIFQFIFRNVINFCNFIIYSIGMSFICILQQFLYWEKKRKVRVLSKVMNYSNYFLPRIWSPFPFLSHPIAKALS